MNTILNIQIDVPELVQAKIQAAQNEIEGLTGFKASASALYAFALDYGVDNITQPYIDAVIIAAERIKERELSLSALAGLSK